MQLNQILLVIAALLPAIILCIYIFIKDRAEKEPVGLLLGLLFLGVLICYPAAMLETGLEYLLNRVFYSQLVSVSGEIVCVGPLRYLYYALDNFIVIAMVEEGLKWTMLVLFTRKNKNFNSLFDGLIYAVFVSLGFAAFENILYVLNYGWANALMRALTAVPGHMFFAVFMGYFYSMWNILEKAKAAEKHLKQIGAISPGAKEFSGKNSLILSILVPILSHGLYDYCCTMNGWLSLIAFYAFLIFMYVYCFRIIKKMSQSDSLDSKYAALLILRKYPYVTETMNTVKTDAGSGQDTTANYNY